MAKLPIPSPSEHLMELWASLFSAGELDQLISRGHFQLTQFHDSPVLLNKELPRVETVLIQMTIDVACAKYLSF